MVTYSLPHTTKSLTAVERVLLENIYKVLNKREKLIARIVEHSKDK